MHDEVARDWGREWSGDWSWVYTGTDFFLALFFHFTFTDLN